MSDYRPISLCNVLYKTVTKVIVNRFNTLLPKVNFVNQSAFVANRLITDDVLVAFELIQCIRLRKLGKVGIVAMKLDMSKA